MKVTSFCRADRTARSGGIGCTERSEEASVIQSTVGTDRRADEGVA